MTERRSFAQTLWLVATRPILWSGVACGAVASAALIVLLIWVGFPSLLTGWFAGCVFVGFYSVSFDTAYQRARDAADRAVMQPK